MYIACAEKTVELEKKFLNKTIMRPEEYKKALELTQRHAAILLYSELMLARILRKIEQRRGVRKADKKTGTKSEIIKKQYNLSRKQAINIQKLTKECVDETIQETLYNNEIPTRAQALAKTKSKNKQERGDVEFNPIIEDEHKTLHLEEPIKATSLFANVGIGTYFLNKMGIECVVSSELLDERAKWHEEIYPNCTMVRGDFSEPEVFNEIVSQHKAKGAKMVLASPPCQTFSNANTAESKSTDIRSLLFHTTLEFILRLANPAKKNRTYGLSNEFENLITQ